MFHLADCRTSSLSITPTLLVGSMKMKNGPTNGLPEYHLLKIFFYYVPVIFSMSKPLKATTISFTIRSGSAILFLYNLASAVFTEDFCSSLLLHISRCPLSSWRRLALYSLHIWSSFLFVISMSRLWIIYILLRDKIFCAVIWFFTTMILIPAFPGHYMLNPSSLTGFHVSPIYLSIVLYSVT